MKHRMLIIRSAGIGDVAMAVHAVRALRETYPELGITIATKPRMVPFFDGIPDLEFVGVKSPGETMKAALAQGTDLVADLRNEPRGKIIRLGMLLKGCKVAGYRQEKLERHPLLRRFHKKKKPLRNNVLRFCDVFSRLGYPVSVPRVPERTVMDLPDGYAPKEGRWAGVAPFSSCVKKNWPLDMCSELIGRLCTEFDRVFIFSGPGKELEYARDMEGRFPQVRAVFGTTDIAGEVRLMSNLDIVVTMDSSAMHMASLAATPFLTIWGCTHPYIGYSAWGADQDKNYIQLDMDCRPCCVYGEGRCRKGDIPCMRGISVDNVIDKIHSLI